MDQQDILKVKNQNQINEKVEENIKEFLRQNNYNYLKLLKKGNLSIVAAAFSLKLRCQVAIKIFFKFNEYDQENIQTLEKRMKALQQMNDDKYVLNVIERIQDEERGLLGIVMEFCDSNLQTILELNKLNLKQIYAVTYQLLKGLLLQQQNGIFNNSNIKTSQVLYSKQKNELLINKLIEDLSNSSSKDDFISDVFSIGVLIIQAFLQRKITQEEQEQLQVQSFISVFPLQYNQLELEFIHKILSQLVDISKDKGSQLASIIQNLEAFGINEEELKQLKLEKELRRLQIFNFDEISKGIDYEILHIDIKLQSIDDRKAIQIGQTLANCQNLTSLFLNLGYNQICQEGIKSIGLGLQQCQNIIQLNLNLHQNSIYAEGVKSIGQTLENCQNISCLNLYLGQNNIGDEGVKYIAMSLEKCQNIKKMYLDIGWSEISSEGVKYIAKSLGKCQNINCLTLDLAYNKIYSEGVKHLAASLEKCQNITSLTLYLKSNQIGTEGINKLGTCLENCLNAEYISLHLDQNQFGIEGTQNLGRSLEKCHNLKFLDLNLHWNKLGSEGALTIVNSLVKCQNISTLKLNLGENSIREGANDIGKSFRNCQFLSYLYLDLRWNQIRSVIQQNINLNLKKMKRLNTFKVEV